MKNSDSNGSPDYEGEDRGQLWSEANWESYLREQDEAVRRYLSFYEQNSGHPERLDEAARLMGWDIEPAEASEDAEEEDTEPYTVHRHPVFIATRALCLSLHDAFEKLVRAHGAVLSPTLILAFSSQLHRVEQSALFGVHGIDVGDYGVAICHFKRALADLNPAFQLLDELALADAYAAARLQEFARERLFDLREVWLRVLRDCREDYARSGSPDVEGEDDRDEDN